MTLCINDCSHPTAVQFIQFHLYILVLNIGGGRLKEAGGRGRCSDGAMLFALQQIMSKYSTYRMKKR